MVEGGAPLVNFFLVLPFAVGTYGEGALLELEDDVDDSLTSGRPDRKVSFVDGILALNGGRLRGRDRPPLLTVMAGEHEETELEVGAWLKGDPAYLVDGVPEEA
jgi:hypothetical protein